MSIQTISLSWFRGAGHQVALELNGSSMVIYGKNGSGKSSFVDAIEYAINKGKIEHLSHEYSGRNQEKGTRNTHTPNGEDGKIQITFKNSRLTFEIPLDGTYIRKGPSEHEIDNWDYHATILRQNEREC